MLSFCSKRLIRHTNFIRSHHSNSTMDLNYINNLKQYNPKIFKCKYIGGNELLTILFGLNKNKFCSDVLTTQESQLLIATVNPIEKVKNVFIGLDFTNYPEVEYTNFEQYYGKDSFVKLVQDIESYNCSKII